ncbi:MAG: sulfatase-like hydrolase/transferase [Alphaproteobacteria bacterium]|nr:sulfatase-like hydrolase/transferase [Alphaproteobacteria bacterium]MCB9792006.1 sulfatase-like hydrolase/transferase [Alphaproteobacteria bacterium]
MMLLLLSLLGCSGCRPAQPLTVVVLVDTLRADALGYAGAHRPTSPHLDALVAEEATWFSHAYAASSWTLSSTTSLLTGLYPWAHGVVRDHDNGDLYGHLGAEVPTLAQRARDRGERSAAFINNAFLAPEFGLNQHFDRYDYQGATDVSHRSAADTVTAALAWLDEDPGAAFLLVHLMEPHYDYLPPEPYAGRFTEGMPHTLPAPPFGPERMARWLNRLDLPSPEDQAYVRANYDEEVLATDAAVGALIDGLRARGRWGATTFVLTADHGEELWDYGGFEHGHTLQSAVTHVPLILKAEGLGAGRCDAVVDHIDLHDFLAGEREALLDLASGADPGEDRLAFAQDTLYGPQQLGVASDTLRVSLGLHDKRISLWALDETGMESRSLNGEPNAMELARPLLDALKAERGHLEPTAARDPRAIQDFETFQQLQELGYLDR